MAENAEHDGPEQAPEEPTAPAVPTVTVPTVTVPTVTVPTVTVPTVLGVYGREEEPVTAPLDAASHWDERLWRRA